MKHLEFEQLKNYGERRTNASETSLIVQHLDECGVCFETFQKMFPEVSDTAREVLLDALLLNDPNVFHLDYDEHLRPFVDGEADAVICEIVENHSANCAFCARAVRDLQEFGDSLTGCEIKQNKLEDSDHADYLSRRAVTANIWSLSLIAIALLIFCISGWFFWRQTAPQNYAENNQPPISMSNDFSNLPPESLPPRNIETADSSNMPPAESPANKKSAVAGEKHQSNQTADEIAVAALPPDFRARFRNAVRTNEVALPEFVAELREKSRLRGEATSGKTNIIAPSAQAEKSSRPLFKWRNFAAVENYVVTIYDENFNQIAVSPNLRGTGWRSNISLERGKIYQWEVKTVNSGESSAARFKILDENSLRRLKKIENATPRSPLVRGIGYASEGLLTEAEREFQKAIKVNGRESSAARLKKFLTDERQRR